MVDQPHLIGPLGVDEVAGEAHLGGDLGRDELGKANQAAAGGQQAHLHLGKAEARVVGGHNHVAGQGNLQSPGYRRTIAGAHLSLIHI